MVILKNYFNNLLGEIGYIDLITYFLENFKKIRKADDFVSEFQGKIFNITDTPEQQKIRSIEVIYPGEQGYSFVFKENDRFGGIFDSDFINDALANFRVQLFAEGFFAFRKMNKKYNSIIEFLTNKYGEGIEKLYVYDKTWYDKNAGLIITLRKLKLPRPSISFTITAEEFNQTLISLIQAKELKKV